MRPTVPSGRGLIDDKPGSPRYCAFTSTGCPGVAPQSRQQGWLPDAVGASRLDVELAGRACTTAVGVGTGRIVPVVDAREGFAKGKVVRKREVNRERPVELPVARHADRQVDTAPHVTGANDPPSLRYRHVTRVA